MTRILQIALIGLVLQLGNVHAQERTERVTLGDGVTVLKGDVKGYGRVKYTLSAKPGQQLTIHLKTSNASNYINVGLAGAPEALCQGALTANVCAVQSATAADYVIDVFLMRNAARRGEKARYTLTVSPK